MKYLTGPSKIDISQYSQFIGEQPVEGGYKMSGGILEFLFKDEDKFFTVYLIQNVEGKMTMLGYCSELYQLEFCINKEKKTYLRFLSADKEISTAIVNGSKKDSTGMFIAKLKDIKEPSGLKSWYIGLSLPISFSSEIINTDGPIFALLRGAAYSILSLYNKTINTLASSYSFRDRFSNHLAFFESKDIVPEFIITEERMSNEELRNLLRTNEIVFCGDSGKCCVPSQDISESGSLFIHAVSDNNKNIKGRYYYLVYVKLEGKHKYIKIKMPSCYDLFSTVTENLQEDKPTVFSAAYRNMPNVCELMFYSNYSHHSISLSEYVQKDGKIDFDNLNYIDFNEEEPFYTISTEDFLENRFHTDDIFNIDGLNDIKDEILYALNLYVEFMNFAPNCAKAQAMELGSYVLKKLWKGVRIGLNPYGYLFKLIFKH